MLRDYDTVETAVTIAESSYEYTIQYPAAALAYYGFALHPEPVR